MGVASCMSHPSEIITFGWVWLVKFHFQSDCMILWSLTCLKRINPYLNFWTLGISWTVSYEITSFCLSMCPSICLSVHLLVFLMIGSLVFSDYVYDYSWPWYLVTYKPRFLKKKKKKMAAWIWGKGAKIGPEARFFAIFSSLVF